MKLNVEQALAQLADNAVKQTALLEAMSVGDQGQKSAYSATAGSYTELHGDGSLFGSQSLEREVISAHVRPHGLASMLPAFPSVNEDPRYAILTGFTDYTGSFPTNPCESAPSGFMKAGNLSAQFGRLPFDTQDIDITKVGLRRNRGDFTDLQLYGRVLGLTDLPPSGLNESQILNVVTMAEMVGVGVRMERELSRMLWQGSIANNTAGGGYKEFPGLDFQIATGQVDWDTNTAMPAADSLVMDFGNDDVGGTARDIVEYLSYMEFNLFNNAQKMGLDPATWVLAMRDELWFELSAVWPCRYMTNRCNNASGTSVGVINDNVNTQLRDAMRTGKYIDINGRRYNVVTDTGINEETNATNGSLTPGQYASSIYFIPLTITGNFPATYIEYLDYTKSSTDIGLLNGNESFWTDRGRFMWVVEQNRWCYKLGAVTEQRVVLRVPHLAGRIDSIRYTPLQHLREPYPDSPYFQDGGVSLRSDTDGYAVWK